MAISDALPKHGAYLRNAIAVAVAVSLALGCAEAQGPAQSDSPVWGFLGDRSMGPLGDTVLGTMTEIEQPLKVLVVDPNGVPNPGEQTVIASAPELPGAPRVTFTTMASPR